MRIKKIKWRTCSVWRRSAANEIRNVGKCMQRNSLPRNCGRRWRLTDRWCCWTIAQKFQVLYGRRTCIVNVRLRCISHQVWFMFVKNSNELSSKTPMLNVLNIHGTSSTVIFNFVFTFFTDFAYMLYLCTYNLSDQKPDRFNLRNTIDQNGREVFVFCYPYLFELEITAVCVYRSEITCYSFDFSGTGKLKRNKKLISNFVSIKIRLKHFSQYTVMSVYCVHKFLNRDR